MNGWSVYWLIWFGTAFLSFIVPELYALLSGRASDTLSWNVWRMMGDQPGESITTWTAVHVIVGGSLFVCLIWLAFHLTLGIWR